VSRGRNLVFVYRIARITDVDNAAGKLEVSRISRTADPLLQIRISNNYDKLRNADYTVDDGTLWPARTK